MLHIMVIFLLFVTSYVNTASLSATSAENNNVFETNDLSEVDLDSMASIEQINNEIPVLVVPAEKKIDISEVNIVLPSDIKNELKILAQNPNRTTDAIVTDVNIYTDHLLSNIAMLMPLFSVDPMDIPDVHESFEKDLFIVTSTGEVNMTNGLLYYLSTIHRHGDTVVTLDSSNRYVRIDVPIAFDELQSIYNYTANFMGLGQEGIIRSRVDNIEMEIAIAIDFETYKATLESLRITNSGYINVEFMGEPITDWFINIFSDVLSFLLHQLIVDQVSGMMREQVTNALNNVNDLLQTIVHPSRMEAVITNFLQAKIDYIFS